MALPPELLVQPQSIGELYIAAQTLNGPASYVNGTGQLMDPHMFSLLFFKTLFCDWLTPDGTYFVRFVAASTGTALGLSSTPVYARWYVTATGAEVTNATDLSAEKIRVTAIGQ